MRDGLPTCAHPTDPSAIYFRNLYREFFYGPFADEASVTAAINHLDKTVEWWDYDPFCMVHGADPLPKDYVFGFPSVDPELRKRVEAQRLPFDQRPQPKDG